MIKNSLILFEDIVTIISCVSLQKITQMKQRYNIGDDDDQLSKISEEIESRKHIKDPFNQRYTAFTLHSFTDVDDDEIDLTEQIHQVSLNVQTRSELINQMHKSLLKQLNMSKSTSQAKKKEKLLEQTQSVNDVEESINVNLDYSKEWNIYQKLIDPSYTGAVYSLDDFALSNKENKKRVSTRKNHSNQNIVEFLQQQDYCLRACSFCDKTNTIIIDPEYTEMMETGTERSEDFQLDLTGFIPINDDLLQQYIAMETDECITDQIETPVEPDLGGDDVISHGNDMKIDEEVSHQDERQQHILNDDPMELDEDILIQPDHTSDIPPVDSSEPTERPQLFFDMNKKVVLSKGTSRRKLK
jgi:nitrate reductase NapAB chaperone NapD